MVVTGEIITRRRIAKGWTVGDLAMRTNIRKADLEWLEANSRVPNQREVRLIGNALDCRMELMAAVAAHKGVGA